MLVPGLYLCGPREWYKYHTNMSLKSHDVQMFYNLMHLIYFSQVELVINQDISVVILVVKMTIICQDVTCVCMHVKICVSVSVCGGGIYFCVCYHWNHCESGVAYIHVCVCVCVYVYKRGLLIARPMIAFNQERRITFSFDVEPC